MHDNCLTLDDMPVIRSAGLRGFAEVVGGLGGDPAAYADAAGLPREALHADDLLAERDRPVEQGEGRASVETENHVDATAEVLAARCPGCSYVYEVAAGDEHEGFAAGTAWADIPADWCCPDCGVREKVDFVPFEPNRVDAS